MSTRRSTPSHVASCALSAGKSARRKTSPSCSFLHTQKSLKPSLPSRVAVESSPSSSMRSPSSPSTHE
eukprot:scaffold53653_cov70-Phaeocystis_antarctica.AAC.3